MSGRREGQMRWQFVDYIPSKLEGGVVYIAPDHGAAVHLCADGCGERISTPLSPAQWTLTFDGETITLHPSIGNWALPCRSHYIIRRNRVVWAREWSDDAVRTAGTRDRDAVAGRATGGTHVPKPPRPRGWRRLFRRLGLRHRE